ncbi:NUDIX domain-containing protein [Candidatus Woesebacteria bacterium]|nr:NUDIX domain-containing protein [Candidatus Woesebacteria bacterium]
MAQKTKSPISREFSAGGVVYKNDLWLITKSAPSELYPKGFWRLPKGWINEGENLEEAALREVREEAGIKAKIISKIGTEKYFLTFRGKRILKFVTFYLMEWVRDLPDGPGFETEKIEWLPFDEAYKKLSHRGEKEILRKGRDSNPR